MSQFALESAALRRCVQASCYLSPFPDGSCATVRNPLHFLTTNQHPCTSYSLSSDVPYISPDANTLCRHNALDNAGLPFPGLRYNAKFAKNTQIITIWGNWAFTPALANLLTKRICTRIASFIFRSFILLIFSVFLSLVPWYRLATGPQNLAVLFPSRLCPLLSVCQTIFVSS